MLNLKYFKIFVASRTLPSKHTSTLSQPLNPQTANELTKIPRHERINLSARTCRDISTNVSRPRHVRVEVNLTIFLEITQVNFLKKLTYPVNVFHV